MSSPTFLMVACSLRITSGSGVPSLVLSGDLNDLRCVSDEQTKINAEAFVEQLLECA